MHIYFFLKPNDYKMYYKSFFIEINLTFLYFENVIARQIIEVHLHFCA